jgi:hypothetical protein
VGCGEAVLAVYNAQFSALALWWQHLGRMYGASRGQRGRSMRPM